MIDSLVFKIQQLLILAAPVTPYGAGAPGGGTAPPPAAGGDAVQQVVTGGAVPDAPAGLFGGGMLPMALLWGGLIIGFWFLLIRPQKKREKKMKELQSSIKPGDNIVTNGGLFGRVADVGTDCFVIEMGISGRSVKVPILKTDVLGVRDPVLTPPPREAE